MISAINSILEMYGIFWIFRDFPEDIVHEVWVGVII